MRAYPTWAALLLLLLASSCRDEGSSTAVAGSPSAAPSVAASVAPSVASTPAAAPAALPSQTTTSDPTAAAPAPTASAAAEDPDAADAMCMTEAESMDRAKPNKPADAPFQSCAAGVFSHCGGGDGERGHLCSKALDVAKTKRARKTKPTTCCYHTE